MGRLPGRPPGPGCRPHCAAAPAGFARAAAGERSVLTGRSYLSAVFQTGTVLQIKMSERVFEFVTTLQKKSEDISESGNTHFSDNQTFIFYMSFRSECQHYQDFPGL